jgi:saccharopine dehydrogenase-like NADP-dependent oxidoreductase
MKNILVIGAGRSASSLIKYLLDQAGQKKWKVTVGDVSAELVEQKTKGHPASRAIVFDIHNTSQREMEIQAADIVISMLPASMHFAVAADCIRFRKHLVTASYVSKEIAELDAAAKDAGVILLNEIGLDPGIDHMSAMQVIDRIHEEGGELLSFRSYCGGLVAPEYNDNPWGYKFSWNPRNVILAGQGTAQYIENGSFKYIPYNRLFLQTEPVEVKGHGAFEAYANRDSLSYRKPYGLKNIPTMFRGTLRMPGYCKAWNVFVKLGLTDDTYQVVDSEHLTYKDLVEAFVPGKGELKARLKTWMGSEIDQEILEKLEWLGLFSDRSIGLINASPAVILQQLLEEKWKLKEEDKDMIVMQHEFLFRSSAKSEEESPGGENPCFSESVGIKKIVSSLVVKGENSIYTAMAKTVGLPVAIAAGLILDGKIKTSGVLIPTLKEIYEPVLSDLEHQGIRFDEVGSRC